MLIAKVESVHYHRNGISGLGFHLVLFRYRDGRKLRRMAASVFGFDETEDGEHTLRRYDGALAIAVLELDRPEEKWRGDTFAKELFYAVERYEKNRAAELSRMAEKSNAEAGYTTEVGTCICGGSGWTPGIPNDYQCPYHSALVAQEEGSVK